MSAAERIAHQVYEKYNLGALPNDVKDQIVVLMLNGRHATSPYSELQVLHDKLNALKSLPEDWDVYGTPVPSEKTVSEAKRFIDLLPASLLNKVSIEPSEWGGVSLRINNERGMQLGIRILDSGITWYVKNNEGTEFHEEDQCSGKIFHDIINSIYAAA